MSKESQVSDWSTPRNVRLPMAMGTTNTMASSTHQATRRLPLSSSPAAAPERGAGRVRGCSGRRA